MSDLQIFPISTPGGINQSSPEPGPEDLEELENFAIFRGRLGLRAPLTTIATLTNATHVLVLTEHESQLWALSWSSSDNTVRLHSMDVDGSNLSEETTVWSSVTTKPTVSLVSFTGGDASSPEGRLYMSDWDQNQVTKYYNTDASTLHTLAMDIDADDTSEDLQFSLMTAYKFHVWGTGYFEGSNSRPEMIRFSQPGAIPGTDPAGGTNPREWWTADHRSVGRRGSKITALGQAGDRLIVLQNRATHAIFGSDSTNWTLQTISPTVGCVGPKAVVSIDEHVCYFWASDGPYRTDGSQIQYIGEPIRQLIVSSDAADVDTVAGYSSDDGLVYFLVSPGGADSYHLALVFDHRRGRWLKVVWLDGSASEAEIGAMVLAALASGEGPAGAPTNLTATGVDEDQIDLAWTNGDTNINTDTEIHRGTSTGFTVGAGSLVATVGAGVTSYENTGLDSGTEYFYIVRHKRNNTFSSNSNEDSAFTGLAAPTNMALEGISGGLTVSGTNNATDADIVIERKLASGGSYSEVTTLSDPGESFSHDDTSVTCGAEYTYRAKATKTDFTDSPYSDEVTAVACTADPGSVPDAPSGLTATTVTEFPNPAIDVTWTDNSNNEDEFRIYRAQKEGGPFGVKSAFSYLTSVGANTTSHVDDTMTDDDTTYYYKVTAANTAGESDYSNEDDAELGSP